MNLNPRVLDKAVSQLHLGRVIDQQTDSGIYNLGPLEHTSLAVMNALSLGSCHHLTEGILPPS